MTYNINLVPEKQRFVEEAAARLGLDVEAYILAVLEGKVQSPKLSQYASTPSIPGETKEERNAAQRARVQALKGKYRVPGGSSVDEFLRERHEEAMREMQKDLRESGF